MAKPSQRSPKSSSSSSSPSPSPSSSPVSPHAAIERDEALRWDSSFYCPNFSLAFRILTIVRALSSAINIIHDCDETFNYWEPLHFLLFGKGLQTWEYSPEYAIRSYSYLVPHAVVGLLQTVISPFNKGAAFFIIRMALAFFCAYCEASFYDAVAKTVSRFAGQLLFVFLLGSAGMFHASTAFLPSTFCMYFVMLGFTKWLTRKKFGTILMFAIGVVYGWPFCGVLGIPVAADFVLKKKGSILKFVRDGLLSLVIVLPACVAIDYYFYRRVLIVPLNILMYNVFSSEKGPELYGVEPLSFYFVNGFLNFNVVFFFALVSLPLVLLAMWSLPWIRFIITEKQPKASFIFQLLPLYIWLLIFFSQPHKEERFLYVVYPLICYHAALTLLALVGMAQAAIAAIFKSSSKAAISDRLYLGVQLVCLVFAALSVSRILAIYINYHGSMDVFSHLGNEVLPKEAASGNITVCVGKEWYRFPSHFFFPSKNISLGFLKSDFAGQLPKYFEESESATFLLPTDMNDMNREEPSRYIDYQTCNFIVDQRIPGQREPDYTTLGFEPVFCKPFLDPNRSPSLTRAFYIPGLSEHRNQFNQYCALKRTH